MNCTSLRLAFRAGSRQGSALLLRSRWFSSSSSLESPRVGIVGVGQMGAAVACNLLRNGVEVKLFDLAGESNVPEPLREGIKGASWTNSGKALAEGSDIVITALPKPEHVTAAFESQEGLLEGMSAGMTWIEHSTTDFENTIRVKEMVEAKGAKAIEAPLTGGMQILREGKMVTLVGAEDEAFTDQVRDVIAMSAPRIVQCGQFGHATIIKIYSNILCAVHDVAMGEALCVAKKAGLDMKLVFDAMRVSSGNSFCWETEVPLVLRGEYDPNFTATMMLKDISLGLDLAKKYDVPQPFTEKVAARYQEAIDKYGPDEGSTIPVRLNEDEAGVKLSEGIGNAKAAFEKWEYTSEITNGSFQILPKHVDNPHTKFG